MIFCVTASSGHTDKPVEIASLEDLLRWVEQEGESVIISKDEGTWPERPWGLEIYDDYRE